MRENAWIRHYNIVSIQHLYVTVEHSVNLPHCPGATKIAYSPLATAGSQAPSTLSVAGRRRHRNSIVLGVFSLGNV